MKTDLSLFPFSIRRINITIKTKLTQGRKKNILSKFRINFKYSTKLISPFNFSSHFPRDFDTKYSRRTTIYIICILHSRKIYELSDNSDPKKKKYLHIFKRFPIIKKIKQRQDRSV